MDNKFKNNKSTHKQFNRTNTMSQWDKFTGFFERTKTEKFGLIFDGLILISGVAFRLRISKKLDSHNHVNTNRNSACIAFFDKFSYFSIKLAHKKQ